VERGGDDRGTQPRGFQLVGDENNGLWAGFMPMTSTYWASYVDVLPFCRHIDLLVFFALTGHYFAINAHS
jgi:hypothetical protein